MRKATTTNAGVATGDRLGSAADLLSFLCAVCLSDRNDISSVSFGGPFETRFWSLLNLIPHIKKVSAEFFFLPPSLLSYTHSRESLPEKAKFSPAHPPTRPPCLGTKTTTTPPTGATTRTTETSGSAGTITSNNSNSSSSSTSSTSSSPSRASSSTRGTCGGHDLEPRVTTKKERVRHPAFKFADMTKASTHTADSALSLSHSHSHSPSLSSRSSSISTTQTSMRSSSSNSRSGSRSHNRSRNSPPTVDLGTFGQE